MARITVAGYYGFRNAGDEAVLSGIVSRLSEELAGAELAALSSDPPYTFETHGITGVRRMDPRSLARTIRKSDLLLLGGGGLLQDVTSRRSLWYYLGLVSLAQRYGTPAVAYGLGVGPLVHRDSRALVRHALSRLAGVGVRDAESRDELVRSGVPAGIIRVTGDASLGMPPVSSEELQQAASHLASLAPAPRLGIALRPWGDGRWLPGLVEAVQGLSKRMEASVIVFSMMPAVDYPLAKGFAEAIGNGAVAFPPEVRPKTLAALIGGCDWVLAMRLHALVFASLAGRPALGLEYDPKVRRFAERAGYPALPLGDIAEPALARAFSEFDPIKVQRNMALLREAERGNAAIVRAVLEGGMA